MLTLVFAALAVVAATAAVILFTRLQKQTAAHRQLVLEHDEFKNRYQPITDVEAERGRLEGIVPQIRVNQQELLNDLRDKRRQGEADMAAFQTNIDRLRAEFNALDEEASLQSFGFYKPRYAFADSLSYQGKLDEIREGQKKMIKEKKAAVCRTEWTVNGSKVEGRKQINQMLKLMLRAFNGECDAAVAKVKYDNVQVMETRIRKAYEAINGMRKFSPAISPTATSS